MYNDRMAEITPEQHEAYKELVLDNEQKDKEIARLWKLVTEKDDANMILTKALDQTRSEYRKLEELCIKMQAYSFADYLRSIDH